MCAQARGPPFPGYCQHKVTYSGGCRGNYLRIGLTIGEKVNCPNKARIGSRHCSSHKKFDTPEEMRAVMEHKAKLAADRAKRAKAKEDLKAAEKAAFNDAFRREMER
jgi:hypothetical protein